MAAGLWQVGLWQEGGQAAYSHGQFRSVFSVKLFIELSRPRPDFIDIMAPTDASSADDVDWIKAELSRDDRYPNSFKIANTSSRATLVPTEEQREIVEKAAGFGLYARWLGDEPDPCA